MKRIVLPAGLAAATDRRAIDELGIPGAILMERAALAGAHFIEEHCPDGTILALCGRGNNGGDGVAMARILAAWGRNAIICMLTERDLSPDNRLNLAIARKMGLDVHVLAEGEQLRIPDGTSVIIDAVYGIGFQGKLDDHASAALSAIDRSTAPILAIDMPSGSIADTGTCDSATPTATWTMAPGSLKWAHVTGEASARSGHVFLADIGLPAAWLDSPGVGHARVVEPEEVRRRLAPLDRNVHKGARGLVLLMAGSPSMPGAATLAAHGAFRGGAGRVTVAADPEVLRHVLVHVPECTSPVRDAEPDVILVGCGRGRSDATLEEVRSLATGSGPPVVVDADALSALATLGERFSSRAAVLTPHPGELATLLGMSTGAVLADLPSSATTAAERYDAVVVAKAAGAIIATPEGNRWVVEPGSPGMATAGAGDVLAGLIAGLLPGHDVLSAAMIGTWIHAQAGRIASRKLSTVSMRASDILDSVPDAFRLVEP